MTRSVPELSLKAFTHGDAAQRAAFSDAMMRGLQDYGFFVLKDHGVPLELLGRAYAEAEGLFALPEATKRRYARGMRGYTPFGVEHAKDSGHPDLKEFWQVGHDPSPDAPADEPFEPNVWPAEAPGVRAAFSQLFGALNETGVVLRRADLLVVNEGEAGDYGRRLHGLPGLVAVTWGSRGAGLLRDGVRVATAEPPEVDAVDTTGAGDTFVGALVVAMLEGMAPAEALRFACAAGALTATKAGAQSALPWRAEVEAVLGG